jgi:hypothetical protein
MSKKFIISEEEKNQIKGLYNLNEQAGDILQGLADSILKMLDSDFKKIMMMILYYQTLQQLMMIFINQF